jgi:hypothetical protein
MDDIYSLLIGSAPTTEEQQRAAVNALRRRRQLGELGALTGDRVLRSFGEGLSRQADDAVKQISATRLKEADDRRADWYQRAQIEHMRNTLDENTRHSKTMEEIGLLNALIALQRAQNSGSKTKDPARLRQSDIKELRSNASALGIIDEMMNYDGPLGQVEVGGVPIPYARQILNKAASMGLGTDQTKETALMWQTYRRLYDILERKENFGATLTPNEQASWREANPSSAQTKEQIMEGLRLMRRYYQEEGDAYAEGLKEEGYNPDAIDKYRKVREPSPANLTNRKRLTDAQRKRLEELRRKRDAAERS